MPPRTDLWPVAVRSAELLRGSLIRCGPGVRPAGWPETPRVRLAALAPFLCTPLLHSRVAVARMSAAWVWGTAKGPGTPLRLTALGGMRRPESLADVVVHELGCTAAETVRFGDFRVTSPIRTVYDLLYQRGPFTASRITACRLLLRLAPDGYSAVAAAVEARRRPYREEARSRLARLR